MSGSQNAKSGCFSSILRRILCQGSLQTHPSDQIPELINRAEFGEPKMKEPVIQAKIQTLGTLGVVARLMGLDSLPETNWVPTGKSLNSVTRSRSVNFMDYLLKFDPVNKKKKQMRSKVKKYGVEIEDLKQKKNKKKNTTNRLVVKKKKISQENLPSLPRADRNGDSGATRCIGEISNLVW
ncbi:hypothetical protein LWI28_006855 [Acer negundo]|uniref:DUF3741 domain-containing protein n=1 Tax=Acer negundo TaxID=4023 RepID=A0AAD5NU99_ACENE|nr:hypothetical protein LWI28_006855 [Acer negundo]